MEKYLDTKVKGASDALKMICKHHKYNLIRVQMYGSP